MLSAPLRRPLPSLPLRRFQSPLVSEFTRWWLVSGFGIIEDLILVRTVRVWDTIGAEVLDIVVVGAG